MSGESFFLDWEFYWRFRVGLSKVEVLTGRICCEEEVSQMEEDLTMRNHKDNFA